MRIEYREVTTKTEVYIADDGTVFLNEDECLDYEFNICRKSFECYDQDCIKTDDIEACTYVNLPTASIIDNFCKVCDYIGIRTEGIENPGLYAYSEYHGGRWVNMDEAIARIRGGVKND